jgi:hypothetical protein
MSGQRCRRFRRKLTSQPRCEVKRSGRSQNRLHTQKARMEYLLLGRVVEA